MPVNINPGVTTFDAIRQNAKAFGNDEIRGRVKNNVEVLYTHGAKPHSANALSKLMSKTALGKPLNMTAKDIQNKKDLREQKVQQGADWIRGAIDTQYGEPFRKRVFQHVSQQNPQSDLDHRITKHDLGTIQDSIETLLAEDKIKFAAVKSFIPAGMALVDTEAGLKGHTEVHLTGTSAAKAHDFLSRSLLPEKQKPVVSQFEKDVGRSAMRLHNSDTPQVPGEKLTLKNGMETLKRFVGDDDTVAENLSRFLTQYGLSTVTNTVDSDGLLRNEEGQRVKPAIKGADAETQKIDVTKNGDDFVIEYRTDNRIGMHNRDNDDIATNALPAESTDLHLQSSLKIRISRDDLSNGNLDHFRIEGTPTARLEINL